VSLPVITSTPAWVQHAMLGLCILAPPGGLDGMPGVLDAFCWPALEWPELEIKTLAWGWRDISACYMEAMPRMSFSWSYTLPTSLAEGAGKVSRSTTTAAMFWLALAKVGHCAPSWLMAVTTSLDQAWVVVRSTVMHRSALNMDLRWRSSAS
jgi:hypothetical protein